MLRDFPPTGFNEGVPFCRPERNRKRLRCRRSCCGSFRQQALTPATISGPVAPGKPALGPVFSRGRAGRPRARSASLITRCASRTAEHRKTQQARASSVCWVFLCSGCPGTRWTVETKLAKTCFFFPDAVIQNEAFVCTCQVWEESCCRARFKLFATIPPPPRVCHPDARRRFACACQRQGGSPSADGRVLPAQAAYLCTISAHWEILRTAHPYWAGSE